MTPRRPNENRHPSGLPQAILYGVVVGGVSTAATILPDWALVLVTGASYVFFLVLWRQRFYPDLSYVDPGILFATVILLYTTIPLITMIAFGYNFSGEGDSRLAFIALDDGIIRDVWLCCNLVMAGFCASYLAVRKPFMIRLEIGVEPLNWGLWPTLILSTLLFAAFVAARGFGAYTDEYLFVASLPLLVVQILNISISLLWASLFGVLIANARDRIGLALGLAALFILLFFFASQARTNLVFVAMALLITRDHFRKRISAGLLATLAGIGLGTVLLLGLVREGRLFGDALAQNEFMSVFVTELDVNQLYVTGSTGQMNLNLVLTDLVRLIPQQLLPFEKVDPASWYINTFYPDAGAGGAGYAFGMIAESMLGGGAMIGLVRGLVLGAVVSLLLNYLSKKRNLWASIAYMWLFVNLYECFRDTTFTLGGRFFFQFGPALLILYLMTKLFVPGIRGATPPAARNDARPCP